MAGLLSCARISLQISARYFSKTWRAGRLSAGAASVGIDPRAADTLMNTALAFTVVLMAILGATLYVVGLERLIIRGRFTLFSMVPVLLRCTFLLFLPLLTYMFSQNKGREEHLEFILLWMLLIELIRKKVQAMVQSADGSFSRAVGRFKLIDHSDEVTRLVWIGYLIYSNVQEKALVLSMFVILWSLALVKLGQRVLNKWKAQDSLAAAGNTHLIAGYMQHVVAEEHESVSSARAPADVMAKCKYVVMGEEKLLLKKKERRASGALRNSNKVLTTPHCGYGVGRFPRDQNELKHVHLLIDPEKVKDLVTIENIWEKLPKPDTYPRLCCFSSKRWQQFSDQLRLTCLSFSLFKLLRRRFEHYPMVEVGSKMARRQMLEGLLTLHGNTAEDNAHGTFQVLQLELDFLENYYQAGVPIVMSSPWLFFINFLFSLLFVLIYFLSVLVVLITSKGNQRHTEVSFLLLYFFITILLVITLLLIEITEFLTLYLLSNWFLVHLICSYIARGNRPWNWLRRPIICFFIAGRFLAFCVIRFFLQHFLRRPVNTNKIMIRQVSILQVCEPIRKLFAWSSQVTLATKAKVDIVKSLKRINPLDTGKVTLPHIDGLDSHVKTTTEIILQCHLATELLEIKHGKRKKIKKKHQEPGDDRTVATTLSRYCMYLVARAPELLPDNERWVSDRYDDVRSCLKKASRHCCSGSCTWSRRGDWEKLMHIKAEDLQEPTTCGGVKLFQERMERDDKDEVWKELAEFWVNLLVYLAPSNDVEGHANALASTGGDLIAFLWAFCTHAGITRQQAEQHDGADKHGSHQV